MTKVLFENHHLYYLPNFIPVIQEMRKRNSYKIIASISNIADKEEKNIFIETCKKLNIDTIIEEIESERILKIKEYEFDVVIVGNIGQLNKIVDSDDVLTVMIYHGIGLKQSYYNDIDPRIDLRSVESESRMKELKSHGHNNLALTGFTKCDPLSSMNQKKLNSFKLDQNLKTILYAPSFYPSSIDMLNQVFPELSYETNLIIKLHNFSWFQDKYKNQSKMMLELAEKNRNIFLVPRDDYNIIPYYYNSDLLISDISSTIFEFLYLNRPIIMAECFNLRLKHKIFNKRFIKKMDLSRMESIDFVLRLEDPNNLISLVYHSLEYPKDLEQERLVAQREYLFKLDGKASYRMVNAIESKLIGSNN